jgi:hypothetical protein
MAYNMANNGDKFLILFTLKELFGGIILFLEEMLIHADRVVVVFSDWN